MNLFQKVNVIKEIRKRRLMWAWRKTKSYIQRVIEKESVERRPNCRPYLIWEDIIKKDVEALVLNRRLRKFSIDRNGENLFGGLFF